MQNIFNFYGLERFLGLACILESEKPSIQRLRDFEIMEDSKYQESFKLLTLEPFRNL